MRILIAALMIAVMAGSAHAQMKMQERKPPSEKPELTEAQKQADEAAYKAATQRLGSQKTEVDPWGAVRGSGTAAQKPAAGTK